MRTTLMLLPLLAAAVLYAEDTTAQQLKVREMIQAVQNAPEGERYQRMNEFKQMIRSMNAEKRGEAIAQMRKAAGEQTKAREKTQTRTQVRTEEGEGEMTRTRERKQMQNLQKQQSQQQIQQRSQMNKQQQINRVITPQSPMAPQGPGSGTHGNRP